MIIFGRIKLFPGENINIASEALHIIRCQPAVRTAVGQNLLVGQIGTGCFLIKEFPRTGDGPDVGDPEFFYHVLPYAMALGVENQWVRAFSGIYIEPVRWYSGRDAADIYVISSFSRRWNHAYVTVVAPQQSRGGARTYRGSSGFSGGGFSGGGGRSW